jgi:hypothetical protein
MPPTIDWMEMYLLSASVDVDEKNATSFLKARNSKIMCRTDTTIVAAVVTSSCQSVIRLCHCHRFNQHNIGQAEQCR